jgi:Domain of unknown function (DUF4865)
VQAMQYEFTFPADYDMEVVRHRVKTKGGVLDGYDGLGLKAWTIRERGVDGSPVNQYASFYLWNSLAGMNRFLWGDFFRNLSRDFGRPVVRQWTGLGFVTGPATAAAPTAATRQATAVEADADPAEVVEAGLAALEKYAVTPGVHSSALFVDTRHWEMVNFTLWEGDAPDQAGTRYQVLHLSDSGLSDIDTGRHW